MKTIFIATDFSPASRNATLFGIEMANVLHADVVLFNAYVVPLSIPESYIIVNPDDVKQAALAYLMDEKNAVKDKCLQHIHVLAEEGSATETILKNARMYTDCLLVAGMKGEGRNFKKWFGSTTSGLARKSDLPLLIVPEEARLQKLQKMALGVDVDFDTNLRSLDALREIGLCFQSRVDIVRVLNYNAPVVNELSIRSSHLMNSLKPLETAYQFPRADDVMVGLDEFIRENKVDMLCLMPQHHTLFERIFVRSETRKLIFHAHIPLLLLPEITPEKTDKKSRPAEMQVRSSIS